MYFEVQHTGGRNALYLIPKPVPNSISNLSKTGRYSFVSWGPENQGKVGPRGGVSWKGPRGCPQKDGAAILLLTAGKRGRSLLRVLKL